VSGSKDTAKDLIADKRISFGFYEDASTGNLVYWGPYLIEVYAWLD
jgi:hypothetical protein